MIIYVIDLLINFDISSTFNIEDLEDYKGLDFMLLVDGTSLKPIFESPSLSPLQDI